MRLVGTGESELKIIRKYNQTEGHKERVNDVKRSKQLNHR